MEITAKELAVLLNAKTEGNPNTRVNKLAKIEEADADSFCFLGNSKYFHYAQTAKAGILLCDENLNTTQRISLLRFVLKNRIRRFKNLWNSMLP